MKLATHRQDRLRAGEPAWLRSGSDVSRQRAPDTAFLAPAAEAIHTSPRAVAQRQRLQQLVGAPVQCIGLEQAKTALKGGGLLSNLLGSFVQKHVSVGQRSNIDFARTHARRPNPPQTNTVVADARALKDALAAGTWVAGQGGQWVITAASDVPLQDTTRRGGAIAVDPPRPQAVASPDQPEHFEVEGGRIESVTGVSADELDSARKTAGPYPKNGNAVKKRDHRRRLVDAVTALRATAFADDEATWVRTNFSSIGNAAIDPNATTRDAIEAIPTRGEKVRVTMNTQGEVYHFDGYD